MINALRTNNFKKLTSLSATFVDGTNLVVGENAQGKSSSFEAIRFALFGARGVVGSVESLTTWGQAKMWVELDIADVTIRRTSSNCKITDSEGEVVASGNVPCTKYVEGLLGCTLKDFDLLYMSRQGEASALITFGATELNRKVEEYAGVSLIDRVIKKLGSEINAHQIALQSFEFVELEPLQQQLQEVKTQGESAAAKLAEATANLATLKEEYSSAEVRLSEATTFNQAQDDLAEARRKHDLKLERLKSELDSAKKHLAAAKSDSPAEEYASEEQLQELDDWITAYESNTSKLAKLPEVAELETKRTQALENFAEYIEFLRTSNELADLVANAQSHLDKAKLKQADLSAKANAAYSELYSAEKALESGICQSCHRPLEDHDQGAAEQKVTEAREVHHTALTEVGNYEPELIQAQENLELASAEYRDHNKTNPGAGWDETAEELEKQIADVELSREQHQLALNKLGTRTVPEVREELNQLATNNKLITQSLKRVKQATQEVDDAQHEFDFCAEDKYEAPQPKLVTTSLEAEVTSLREDMAKSVEAKSDASTQREVLKERYRSCNNELQAAEANNKKLAEMHEQADVCKQLRKFLNDERVKFMEGVWRTILGTATNFIRKSTDGWVSAIGRNDKGDFTFTENGTEAVARESASGAQKAFIGTAIKVGLAQAKMGSSSLVMLDEPTADMRGNRAAQLAAGLMGLPGQKIMITHRDSERLVAQNILHIGDPDSLGE